MSGGLSPRAQRLYSIFAPNQARRLGSTQVYPEHLMIAVILETDGGGYDLLKKLGINIPLLLNKLEEGIRAELPAAFFGTVPNSPRMRAVLEVASAEAAAMGHEYVETPHLVLACLCEELSVCNLFLRKENIPEDRVRSTAKELYPEQFMFLDDRNRRMPGENSGPSVRVVSVSKDAPQNRLSAFCRDITKECAAGKIDPVVGRQAETRRLMQVLSRRTKNNPLLVGDPGVGKTAIVEGLAAEIAAGCVPPDLCGLHVLELDLASVVAGTKFRGEFEDRFKRILREIENAGNVILFIDEIHMLVGAGSADGGTMDASNMLKPALARGKLHCIGATTQDEYRKHIEKDSALARRFQVIPVSEPSPEQTLEILRGLRKTYSAYHHVEYTDEALSAAVSLAQRYIPFRFFPDKAIDVLDEAGSRKKIDNAPRPEMLQSIEDKITALNEQKQTLVKTQNYERAALIRDEVLALKKQLRDLQQDWHSPDTPFFAGEVSAADVAAVVAEIAGVPASLPDADESLRLLSMEEELHRSVVGQHEAVSAVAAAIRRNRAGFRLKKHPAASFIFMGPTGVGKTLLAKSLAKFLFGTESAVIRVDMSEYMEKLNVSKLIGAPPGYVGYDEGGYLTEKIRRRPYSVVLLDEIEKAHPDVFGLLLQILEEGELYDGSGRLADFSNAFIIMTGNVGARFLSGENRMGFSSADTPVPTYAEMKAAVSAELKRYFTPEFLNRVDDVIVFTPLSDAEISAILDIRLKELSVSLASRDISLSVSAAARAEFVRRGYAAEMGARPMDRLVRTELEDPLAGMLLSHRISAGDTVRVDAKDGGIVIKTRRGRRSVPDPSSGAEPAGVCP